MKFLLFGTGDYYGRFKKWFDEKDIVALLDNSVEKQNTLIDGHRVLPPKEGVRLPFDAIVILSFYVKAMRQQLLKLGVAGNKIFHFYDLYRLPEIRKRKWPLAYYGGAEPLVCTKGNREKKILLLSHDMALGGASIALFHAARIMAENDYKIVVASMLDGPLREKLVSNGIPVIVDNNLQVETMKGIPWINGFSLIFCSTINFHVFLSDRDNQIPVIWWLHDASFFYEGADKELLSRLDRTNMKVCAVGPVAEGAMKKFVPGMEIEELLYGVPDYAICMAKRKGRPSHDRICFTTIGDIGDVKGQDILVGAVRALPDNFRRKTRFYLVGRSTSAMAQRLKEEIGEMPEIVMTGLVDRERIHEILEETDVLICPSREDSMPTAAAEAMMHRVPCIVSDATGTAGYIQDGMDGFIFSSESIKELSEKIIWCIENQEKLPEMGALSRKIYDTYFSMGRLKENLLRVVESMWDRE